MSSLTSDVETAKVLLEDSTGKLSVAHDFCEAEFEQQDVRRLNNVNVNCRGYVMLYV